MFQETIEITQVGRFDGYVRHRRKLGAELGQGDHGLRRERLSQRQQDPQSVVHRRLAVARGVLQNVQVRAAGDVGRMFGLQPVVSYPKAAVGEQVLAIAIVLERARLAHELIDNVPIVDDVLVAPHQPRQRVDQRSRVPNLHAVGMQPGLDLAADQAAVDRVGVAVDMDQAPRVHAHRQPQTTIQPLRRKRPERRQFLGMPFAPGRVAGGDHLFQKPQVFLTAGEVPAATQEQSLIHGGLEVSVGRFGVAVLVWLANVNPLARQAVVFQEPPIAALKLAFGR